MPALANRLPAPRRVHHRATTASLQALLPFIAESSLGSAGVYIGTDAFSRSPFYYDPIRMYLDGVIGDPNILVIGRLGYGKSALMKALSRRLNVVGYSTIYLDPKGETTPLAHAYGVRPLRLTAGGELRLNPLDEKLASAAGLDPTRERELLMRAVLPVMLERPLRPAELRIVSEVVREVVARCAQPTLRDVHAGLAARGTVTSDPADALWDYIHGPAGALFDAPTSAGVDLDAPLLALNLRRLTQTLTAEKQRLVTLALAAAWLFAIVSRRRGYKLFVADEAWFMLRHRAAAEWFQAQWKLCRATSTANVAVLHRLSDLEAVDGTMASVRGLLADCATKVIFNQEPGEIPLLQKHLGLSSTEVEYVRSLGRAWALWRVGERSFVVKLDVQPAEWTIVDTDGAMRGEVLDGSED